MKYEYGPRESKVVPYWILQVMALTMATAQGCENSWRKPESRSMIVRNGQLSSE